MKPVTIFITGLLLSLLLGSCGETSKVNLKKTEPGNDQNQPGNKQPEKKLLMKKMWIKARSGLRMREGHDLTSSILAVIPYNCEVMVMEEHGNDITIAAATGRWSKISWKGQEGWVFGGFLSAEKLPNIVVQSNYLIGTWCPDDAVTSSANACYELGLKGAARIIYRMGPNGTWSLKEGHIVEMDVQTASQGPDGEKYISRPYSVRMEIKEVYNWKKMLVDLQDDFLDRNGLKKMVKVR